MKKSITSGRWQINRRNSLCRALRRTRRSGNVRMKKWNETPSTSKGDRCVQEERGRRKGWTKEWRRGVQKLLTLNIFTLQGAGAEGPTAVSCNRTSLFVSAQGSLRAINGTQPPLCGELVSVSLETDKHIMQKCQAECVTEKGFWDWSATVIPSLLHWQ